jgi:hypothetical protein
MMSSFAANKVIVVGGTGGPNSLEKTLFGSPEQVSRGNFVRKSVIKVSATDNEILTTGYILCENCAHVFSENGDWGENNLYPSRDHYTFPGVIESAENGCHLCVLLLNHIPPKTWEQLQRRVTEGLEQPYLNLRVRRQEFVNDRSAELKYYVELSGFELEDENTAPYSIEDQPQLKSYSFTLILEPQKLDCKYSSKPKCAPF